MIRHTSLERQLFDRVQKIGRKLLSRGGRGMKGLAGDIRDCALVACGFAGLGYAGMCLLTHPILLAALVVLGSARWWQSRARTPRKTPELQRVRAFRRSQE